VTHALTIDVEDYWSIVGRDYLGLDGPPSEAVVRNTERVLDTIESAGTKATFFILGEVARTYPALVRRIAEAGHELGVHGDLHRQVFKLDRSSFADEIRAAKESIEDIAGQKTLGHRAPAFSIMPKTAWALEVLAELGLAYDSSVYPIAGRRYGWPGFPLEIHNHKLPNGSTIIEAPLATVRILGRSLPCCGGGYVRHFPYAVTRWAMRRIAAQRPAIVYAHPYEIDVDPPPPAVAVRMAQADRTFLKRHRSQLRNRGTVRGKLQRLLAEFNFAPLQQVIAETLGAGAI